MNQYIKYIKPVFWILLLGAVLLLGAWLSGYLLFLWFGFNGKPVGLGTWYAYYKQLDIPKVAVFASKIKVSGAAGFGVPLLAYLGVLALSFKSAPKSTHGDSKFAERSDLAAHGLLNTAPTGVIIGRIGNQYLRDSSGKFVILAAPTRSGKGVGVVIPILLDYSHSIVVLDIKGENFNLTSGYRVALGQKVFVFNPFAADGQTHRWNPLRYVSPEHHKRIGDLRAIGQMLYPDGTGGGNERFFSDNAKNVFLALSLYLFEKHDAIQTMNFVSPYPSFGELYRTASGNGTDLKTYLQGLSQATYLSDAAKTAFAGILSQSDDTFSSIMGTFNAPLTAWADPFLDAATSGDDFLLTDVRKMGMTIYLCVSPNKLSQAALILNLFFSQLINENTKTLPQEDSTLTHQCLLLMDEFTSIGPVDIIAHAVSYMAGYNIRLLPIIQSMAQLDATYGVERARTLITNHATQIIYTPREQQDANDYSEMLGYTTVKKRNRSTNRGRETSHTYSDVEERRALMLPQELKAMSADKEILIIEGMNHPAQVDKIRYYQEKLFKDRLYNPVTIPTLNIKPTANKQPSLETAVKSGQIQPQSPIEEQSDMDLKQLTAAAITASSLATATVGMAGCDVHNPSHNSVGEKVVIGDEFRISKNPNPQHAYKLKVKIKDAPAGGFGDAWGSTSFRIDNIAECGYYLGGSFQGTVPGVKDSIELPLIKLSDTEYEGSFYIDGAKDGDFFGKGVCHWKMVTVGMGFSATGKDGETRFVIGFQDEELHNGATVERFYLKEDYPINPILSNAIERGITEEVVKKYHKHETVFSITLAAEEIK